MHIIMPMHYVAKIEIEPFPPSGPPNFQNVVAPVLIYNTIQYNTIQYVGSLVPAYEFFSD